MIELLIGAVVAAGVGRYIIKGYSATGVLMVGGLIAVGNQRPDGQKPVACQCCHYRVACD